MFDLLRIPGPAQAVLVLGATLMLGGCGGSTKSITTTGTATTIAPSALLDTHRVATSIQQSILSERHIHAEVNCPSGIVQRAGATFTCTAVSKKATTPFAVTVVNDRGYVTYIGE